MNELKKRIQELEATIEAIIDELNPLITEVERLQDTLDKLDNELNDAKYALEYGSDYQRRYENSGI